ncbi:hypothetical protein RHSIM_Rhsim01G0214200 [Rhododendron simsii]|uniref:glucose-1-phosphate adenylyltransferase n=1 Tax=Rhododendron simsii TaxID=118357 RepID=A0A834HQR6_RHOSS|nr:hypothetical protein RHSIM_Rhsim01G0214200 [Rhododendron simsii]
MGFQAVWDFADDDPVGGGVAATFSKYLHRRSYFLVFLVADLFMCADTSYFLGFSYWENLGLRDLMKVVKLHTTFVANPTSDAMKKNVEHILILSGDHLYSMDYMDFVQYVDSQADIMVSCVPMDDRHFIVFRLNIVPTHSEASNSFGVGDSSLKKSVRAQKGGDK